MKYIDLVKKCQEKGIRYSETGTDGKTKWFPKAELEKLLGETPDEKQEETKPMPEKKSSGSQIENAILSLMADFPAQNLPENLEQRIAALEKTRIETPTIRIEDKNEIREIPGLAHATFDHISRLASQRLNILLVGPAGTGKTHLAGQVAAGLGLSFAFLSASAGMSESALEGWLLPTGENGKFAYHPSPFVNAYENGGVFLIDELDSADCNLMTIINSALANGHMAIPKRLENPIVKRHADFVCIAAANTYGHGNSRIYAGRQQLDGATIDRFRCGIVYVDYDAKIESRLILPEILAWGRDVRQKINTHGLRRIMSTRFLRNYSKLIKAYPEKYTLETCKDTYFQDWSQDEKAKI